MVRVPDAPQADSPFWRFWKVGTSAHATIYKLTGGRIGGRSQGAPVALVESVGRKSRKERTHPLICTEDGDDLVIIASKGGIDKHPAWYLNLRAHPETNAWWKGKKRSVRAREVDGSERDRLWEKMVGVYPPYESYQARTERKIPVLVLEPVAE